MRRSLHPIHTTTCATPTGLGKTLAAGAGGELWMPTSTPWDSSSVIEGGEAQVLTASLAVAMEHSRSRQLQMLRKQFRARCENCKLPAPPLNAFERWLLLNKWHEPQSDEPVLPTSKVATPADAALVADLLRAGMDTANADALVRKLRADAIRAAAAIRSGAQHSGADARIRRSPPIGGVVHLSYGDADADVDGDADGEEGATDDEAGGTGLSSRVCVTTECLDKLCALHSRSQGGASDAPIDKDDLLKRVLACLLRYQSIGGLGFQAALGAPVFCALQTRFACNFEVFASPLNCFYGAFCSAYADVDRPFGSHGSFSDFCPLRGSYQANPPFVATIIDAMSARLLMLVADAQAADRPLSFVVVLPGWTDCDGYNQLLSAAPLLRRTLLVAAADHGYVDGGQHTRTRTHRESPYDTMVFVVQSDAAAARWPASDEALADIEAAFARCTPSEEELATVDSTERVHSGRKRKRRKMKRAGKKTRAWQERG